MDRSSLLCRAIALLRLRGRGCAAQQGWGEASPAHVRVHRGMPTCGVRDAVRGSVRGARQLAQDGVRRNHSGCGEYHSSPLHMGRDCATARPEGTHPELVAPRGEALGLPW
jgi:hypothetical protein